MSGLLPLPSIHLAAENRSPAFYIWLLRHPAVLPPTSRSLQWTGIFLAHSFIPLGLRLSFILHCHAPGVWRYTDFQLTFIVLSAGSEEV
jgi:hypothetical protein